jgi:putative restriction endonuclease
VCGFNFEKAYGDYAKGFIHIHHIVPVSEFGDSKTVNPQQTWFLFAQTVIQ